VIDDPCTDGNNGNLLDGNGSEPPPDLDYSSNTTYIWGHFVKEFVPPQNSTPSGVICNPSTFEPCVATLVH
jgi:hypothetical protein